MLAASKKNKQLKILKNIGFLLIIVFLIIFFLRILFWAICPNDAPLWTGFGEVEIKNSVVPSKTLWDWLELILIPFFIALTGWLISWNNQKRSLEKETIQNQQNLLKEYLNSIKELLLEKKLRDSEKKSEVRSVARALTLNFFRNSDSERKGIVLQFLFESDLITINPIINLLGVKLNRTNLDRIRLKNVQIKGSSFRGSSFQNSNLIQCDFRTTNFSACNLSNSNLDGTNFTYCDMVGVIIRNVDLRKTILEGVDFSKADLTNSILSQNQYNSLKSTTKSKIKNKPKIQDYE